MSPRELLRVPQLVVRRAARRHAGSDGLTPAERAESAARYQRIMEAPPRPGSRRRAEHEVQAGKRQIVRISHQR